MRTQCTHCDAIVEVDDDQGDTDVICGACRQPFRVAPTLADTTVGRYHIVRRLGEGGMGEVWLAYDPSLKINVAIKTLPDFLVRKDPSMVTRFEQEARLAARIDHRNICRVYDVGQHDDIHYIVMEYIKGGSVGDMLRERGEPLSVFESLSIIKGVTVGLCAAENASIVHRDIKPDNILIDEGGVPKLADLGLAKSLADGAELTMTGASMGTAAYIAPEQAQDSKRADTRSDIYSLGATLYHMITGKVPFHGDTPFSVMMKHVRDPVPDPSEYNPDVTREVTNLVWKMMEKNPDKRYPSARSLHLAVDETERRYQASSVRRKKSVSRQRKKAVSRQPDLDPRPKKRRRKEPVAPAPKKPEAAADEVPAVSDPVQAPDEANASERGKERKVTKDPGNAKNANDSSSSKRRGKHPKGRPRPAVGDDVLGDSGKPIRIVASVLGTVVGAVLGISLFMQMTSSPPLEPDPIPERPVATPPDLTPEELAERKFLTLRRVLEKKIKQKQTPATLEAAIAEVEAYKVENPEHGAECDALVERYSALLQRLRSFSAVD